MDAAIILSGGVGTRVGADIPKQYIKVGKHPIIYYSLATFAKCSNIGLIVIVVADAWLKFVSDIVDNMRISDKVIYARAGITRQFSIYNGLTAIDDSVFAPKIDSVIIHDAARPLVKESLIERCFDACCEGYDGALPVIPVKDTVYMSIDGKSITSLLDRSSLYAGQAPEAFNFKKYLAVHRSMPRDEIAKINGSSEIAHKAGLKIGIVQGDILNFKITDSEDLARFKSIVE